ncbi:MAG: hypothetical protein JSV62_04490 [Promethearchaeota archaeon]|nr:MAG: hypothetical protein JSV62_04490 [Candidatus Lokiarchaeota archaeon]
MGLDKWLKTEDIEKKSKKEKDLIVKKKKEKSENAKGKDLEKSLLNLSKYSLICTNKKCKFQKVIVKRQLSENDKICPRCNHQMKIKEV